MKATPRVWKEADLKDAGMSGPIEIAPGEYFIASDRNFAYRRIDDEDSISGWERCSAAQSEYLSRWYLIQPPLLPVDLDYLRSSLGLGPEVEL